MIISYIDIEIDNVINNINTMILSKSRALSIVKHLSSLAASTLWAFLEPLKPIRESAGGALALSEQISRRLECARMDKLVEVMM